MRLKPIFRFRSQKSRATALLVGVFLLFAPGLQAQQTTAAPTSSIDIRVRLGGLFPKTATVPAGTCLIVLTNGAIPAPFDVVLKDSTGKAVAQTAQDGVTRPRQRFKANLTPGTYQVQVVGRPDWVVNITVTSKGN